MKRNNCRVSTWWGKSFNSKCPLCRKPGNVNAFYGKEIGVFPSNFCLGNGYLLTHKTR